MKYSDESWSGREERAIEYALDKVRRDYDLLVFPVHTGNIACAGHRQPVRKHGFGGTLHTSLKNILTALSWTMDLFVIKEYDFPS